MEQAWVTARWRKRIVLVGVSALGLAWPGRALCQQESVAEALFREGRRSMKVGDYAGARSNLEESERLDPSPGTLLNLAICEEQLGHLATAWTKYRELVDTMPKSDPRAAMAREGVATLEPRLPHLRITIATAPANSLVKLDGVELRAASLGAYVPLDPGAHVLTLSTPGGATRERSIRIGVAERMDVELSAGENTPLSAGELTTGPPIAQPASEARGRPPPAPIRRERTPIKDSSPLPQWVGWTAGAIGAAGLVAGAVMGAMVLERQSVVRDTCPNKHCRDQSGVEAADQGKRLMIGTVASLAVGAAGVGLTVYVWTRSDSHAHMGSSRASVYVPSTTIVTWAGAF